MEKIPYISLSPRSQELNQEIQSAVNRVIRSGVFIGGTEVESFEHEWATYCGTAYCIGVSNGLDALRLILIANGIGPGDEVLVPAQTFIATWLAVTQVGAIPVPVDVEEETGNMSLKHAEHSFSPRTKAVILVHLHGLMADVRGFQTFTSRHSLLLIEDAAQSHGAEVGDKKAGSWGHSAAFSFYPTKNLGALGDAGAIMTNDASMVHKIRMLRSYGADLMDKYGYCFRGWNSRLDPIQAAVLRTFLPKLDEWNIKRREIARIYMQSLDTRNSVLHKGKFEPSAHVWHHFVLSSEHRNEIRHELLKRGIQTEVHYPTAPTNLDIFSEYTEGKRNSFTNALLHQSSVLSIPLHPWLHQDVEIVANNLADVLSSLARK
jgi:dTDP-4-amino-4,6-dideoxygalactose transaminase